MKENKLTFNQRTDIISHSIIGLLEKLTNFIIVLLETLIKGIGTFGILVLLMIVEIQRISHGIALFETQQSLEFMAALALVLANNGMEFVISYREYKTGWKETANYEFSLRLLWDKLVYILGFNRNWQPKEKSPASMFRFLSKFVGFTIVLIAAFGSLHTQFETISSDNWYNGLFELATNTTLTEFFTTITATLFTIAAVILAQTFSGYVGLLSREILEQYKKTNQEVLLENSSVIKESVLVSNVSDKIKNNMNIGNKLILRKDELNKKGLAKYNPESQKYTLQFTDNNEKGLWEFDTIEELEGAMRGLYDDLRSWKVA